MTDNDKIETNQAKFFKAFLFNAFLQGQAVLLLKDCFLRLIYHHPVQLVHKGLGLIVHDFR